MCQRTILTAALSGALLALTACGGSNPEGVKPTGKVHYEKPQWMGEGELKEAVNGCRAEMQEQESGKQAALAYYYCLKEEGMANVHFVR